jgi:propanol-preferring alcohol dehydrogenase
VFNPQGARIAELHEVIDFARTGKVTIEVEQFGFDDVAAAYERLQAGTLNGRAVVTVDK